MSDIGKTRPNVLWITSDQQRWDTLGAYGNEWVTTPNLDRLAVDGTRFEYAFCQSPVCTPSRGSFLTGRYPRTCRLRQNGASIPESEVLVTRLLADAGYRCGLSGKLHLSACSPGLLGEGGRERRIEDGYEVFHWSHHSGTMGAADNDYYAWLDNRSLTYEQTPLRNGARAQTSMTKDTSQTAWCTDRARDFIRDAASDQRPWLFSVNYFDPHPGFDPPAEFLEPYLDRLDTVPLPDYVPGELRDKPDWQRVDHEAGSNGGINKAFAWPGLTDRDHREIRAAYWAMCDQIDYHVGRLLQTLEETGQRENTLVIFMADHGELLGDHGIYMKGPFFYEPSVRVPLIISLPGAAESQVVKELVELMDVPETILDACSIDPHPGMQGRTLLPYLHGGDGGDDQRSDVFSEFYADRFEGRGHVSPGADATMLRTTRYKIVMAHGTDEGELYDLERDPGEHTNLWHSADFRDVRCAMVERLANRIAATADPLPVRAAPW